MDNLKLWALVLGLVAVLVSGLVLFSTLSLDATTATRVEEGARDAVEIALPDAVPGMVQQESLPKVDPLFEGETYSRHASYAPEAGSTFSSQVARVGAAAYHFDSPDGIEPALQVLSLGNPLESMAFQGETVLLTEDPISGQVLLFWTRNSALVQVLAVGAADDGFDMGAIRAAGLTVLEAVIGGAD